MSQLKNISKFLSLVLRHKPEEIGLELDQNGWANVDELLMKINNKGISIDFEILEEVVTNNDKQRFTFDDTYTRIRANQGHSLNVNLELQAAEPPELLYHGTVDRFLDGIRQNGLLKMNRQHVHLSKDEETAVIVAKRRGKPVLLTIQSGKMHREGHTFYRSENGVWLCDTVPVEYIPQLS